MNQNLRGSKKRIIALVSLVVAVILIASAVFSIADPTYDLGGGNATGPGGQSGNGNTIPSNYQTSNFPLSGLRFSIVNKETGVTRGTNRNVFIGSEYANHGGRYMFSDNLNKLQRKNNYNPSSISFKKAANGMGSMCTDAGFSNLNGLTVIDLQDWERDESTMSSVASYVIYGNLSHKWDDLETILNPGDVIMVEALFPVQINNTYYFLTMSEYAVIGGQKYKNFNTVPGDTGNKGQVSYIGKYLGFFWPEGMYAPLGSLESKGLGRGTDLGSSYSSAKQQITWFDMINKAYGVHFIYVDSRPQDYTVTVTRSVQFVNTSGNSLLLGNTENGVNKGVNVDTWTFKVPANTNFYINNYQGYNFTSFGGPISSNSTFGADSHRTISNDYKNADAKTPWQYNMACSYGWRQSSGLTGVSTNVSEYYTVNSDLSIRIIFAPANTKFNVQKWYQPFNIGTHSLSDSQLKVQTNFDVPIAKMTANTSAGDYSVTSRRTYSFGSGEIGDPIYVYNQERWVGKNYGTNQSTNAFYSSSNKEYMANGFWTSAANDKNQVNMVYTPKLALMNIEYYYNDGTTPIYTKQAYYQPEYTYSSNLKQKGETFKASDLNIDAATLSSLSGITVDSDSQVVRTTYTKGENTTVWNNNTSFTVKMDNDGTTIKVYYVSPINLTVKHWVDEKTEPDVTENNRVMRSVTLADGTNYVGGTITPKSFEKAPDFFTPEAYADKYTIDGTEYDSTNVIESYVAQSTDSVIDIHYSTYVGVTIRHFVKSGDDYIEREELAQTYAKEDRLFRYGHNVDVSDYIKADLKNSDNKTVKFEKASCNGTFGKSYGRVYDKNTDGPYNVVLNQRENTINIYYDREYHKVSISAVYLAYDSKNTGLKEYKNIVGENTVAHSYNASASNKIYEYYNVVGPDDSYIYSLYNNELVVANKLDEIKIYDDTPSINLNAVRPISDGSNMKLIPDDGTYQFVCGKLTFDEVKKGTYKASLGQEFVLYTETVLTYNNTQDEDAITTYYEPYQYKVQYNKNSDAATDTYVDGTQEGSEGTESYWVMDKANAESPLAVRSTEYTTIDNKYVNNAATFNGWRIFDNNKGMWLGYSDASNESTLGWYKKPVKYYVLPNQGTMSLDKRWGTVTLYADWDYGLDDGMQVYFSVNSNPFATNVSDIISNTNEFDGYMPSQKITETNKKLLKNQLYRDGYKFKGWKIQVVALDELNRNVTINRKGQIQLNENDFEMNLFDDSETGMHNCLYTSAPAGLYNYASKTIKMAEGNLSVKDENGISLKNPGLFNTYYTKHGQILSVGNIGTAWNDYNTSGTFIGNPKIVDDEAELSLIDSSLFGTKEYTTLSTVVDEETNETISNDAKTYTYRYVLVCYAQWEKTYKTVKIEFVDKDGNPAFETGDWVSWVSGKRPKCGLSFAEIYTTETNYNSSGRYFNNSDIMSKAPLTNVNKSLLTSDDGYVYLYLSKDGKNTYSTQSTKFLDSNGNYSLSGPNKYGINIKSFLTHSVDKNNGNYGLSVKNTFEKEKSKLENNSRWNRYELSGDKDKNTITVKLFSEYYVNYDLQNLRKTYYNGELMGVGKKPFAAKTNVQTLDMSDTFNIFDGNDVEARYYEDYDFNNYTVTGQSDKTDEIPTQKWRIYRYVSDTSSTKEYLAFNKTTGKFGWYSTAVNYPQYFEFYEIENGAEFGPNTEFPDGHTFNELVKMGNYIVFEAQYQRTVNVIVEDEDGNLAYDYNAWLSYLKADPETESEFVEYSRYSKLMANASDTYFNSASESLNKTDYIGYVHFSNDNQPGGTNFTDMLFRYNPDNGISEYSERQLYNEKIRMTENQEWSHYSIKLIKDAKSESDTKYYADYGEGDYVIVTLYDDYYNIVYDANGGTGTMGEQIALSGENIQLLPNEFTRENYFYRFWYASYVNAANETLWYGYNKTDNTLGWFNESELSSKKEFADGEVVNFELSKVTVTMHAQWAIKITISYLDGDTNNPAFDSWYNSVTYKKQNVSGDYQIPASTEAIKNCFPETLILKNEIRDNFTSMAILYNKQNNASNASGFTKFHFKYNMETGISKETTYAKFKYGELTPFNKTGESPLQNQIWNAYKVIIRDNRHLDIRLYKIDYTVNYDGNGGKGYMSSDFALPNTDFTTQKNIFEKYEIAQAGLNIGEKLDAKFLGWRIKDDDTGLWYGYSVVDDESTLGWYAAPAEYYLYEDGATLNLNKWDGGSVTLVAQWLTPIRIDYVYEDGTPVFSGPLSTENAKFNKWSNGIRFYYFDKSKTDNKTTVAYATTWTNSQKFFDSETSYFIQTANGTYQTKLLGTEEAPYKLTDEFKLLILFSKDTTQGVMSGVSVRDQFTPISYNKNSGLIKQTATEVSFTNNTYFTGASLEVVSPSELKVIVHPKTYTVNYTSSTNDVLGEMLSDTNSYGKEYTIRENEFYKAYESYFRCWHIKDDNTNLWYGYSDKNDTSTLGWYSSPARYYEAAENEKIMFNKIEGSLTCYAQWKTPFIVTFVQNEYNDETGEYEEVPAFENWNSYVFGTGLYTDNGNANNHSYEATNEADHKYPSTYEHFYNSGSGADYFGKTYAYDVRLGKTPTTTYSGYTTTIPFVYNTNTGIAENHTTNRRCRSCMAVNTASTIVNTDGHQHCYKCDTMFPDEEYDNVILFAPSRCPINWYGYKATVVNQNVLKIVLYTKDELVDHYIVNYDKNAADAFGIMESTKQYKDEPFNLSNNLFTRADYAFKGWHLQDDTTGKWYGKNESGVLGWYDSPKEYYLFANKESCTLPLGELPVNNTSITFYAQWRACFRVHFINEDGQAAFTSWNSGVRYATKTSAGMVPSTAATTQYYPDGADVVLNRTFAGYVVFGPEANTTLNLSNASSYNRVMFKYNAETGISSSDAQVYDEKIELKNCSVWDSYSVAINEVTNDIYITLYEPKVERELSVVYYQPNADYTCDTSIIATFKVTNPTALQYNPDDGMATLRVKLTGLKDGGGTVDIGTYEKQFVIPALKSQNVYFKIPMPSVSCGKIKIDADILYGNKIIGTYSIVTNDGMSGFTTKIVKKYLSKMPDTAFSRMIPDGYKQLTKAEVSLKNTANASKWDEYVYVGNGNYEKKTYYALLRIDAGSTKPNVNVPVWWYDESRNLANGTNNLYKLMRSGYGIDTYFTSGFYKSDMMAAITSGEICSNYDALVPAQTARIYYPENNYGAFNIPQNFLKDNGTPTEENGFKSSYENKFDVIFASHFWNKNTSSWLTKANATTEQFNISTRTYFARVNHFTPMWAKDGEYVVQPVATDCWTPAGMISAENLINTTNIDGSIYSDWRWVHGEANK